MFDSLFPWKTTGLQPVQNTDHWPATGSQVPSKSHSDACIVEHTISVEYLEIIIVIIVIFNICLIMHTYYYYWLFIMFFWLYSLSAFAF